MSDRLAAFQDAYHSESMDDQGRRKTWAAADYTTNTLRVYVPADDPVEMTIVHAFVSREEFMHGEWNVALMNTCARLRMAAIDALYDALDNPERRAQLLATHVEARTVADRLDRAIEPFREAVDKLQILSVVEGDEFVENITDTFDAVHDSSDLADVDDIDGAEDFEATLREEIESQRQLAEGAATMTDDDSDSLYVNPLYYYALRDVMGIVADEAATTDDPDEQSVGRDDDERTESVTHEQRTDDAEGDGTDDDETDDDDVSDRRTVAETVARVTLDVPFPVAPLRPSAEFAPLRVEGLDVDPITPEQLRDLSGPARRYAADLDDEDYRTYLLCHADKIEDDEVARQVGTTVDDYDANWLDAVFVSTLKALDDLAEDTDVTEMDALELRRQLNRRVHDAMFPAAAPNADTDTAPDTDADPAGDADGDQPTGTAPTDDTDVGTATTDDSARQRGQDHGETDAPPPEGHDHAEQHATAVTPESTGRHDDDTQDQRRHRPDEQSVVTTMLNRPTAVLEVPADATDDINADDFIGLEDDPLPKVLIEAFEQHGSFGGVVFRPVEGENDRMLNYHATRAESVAERPDVQDRYNSYEDLWQRYFFGKEMANALVNRYRAYKEHLVDRISTACDGPAGLDRLNRVAEGVQNTLDRTYHAHSQAAVDDAEDWAGRATGRRAVGLASRAGSTDPVERGKQISEQVVNAGPTVDDRLRRRSVLWLREAANQLGVEFDRLEAFDFDPLECPFCETGTEPCCGDECLTTDYREQFTRQLPTLVERLAVEVYALSTD